MANDYGPHYGPLQAYLSTRDANARAGLVDTENSARLMGILMQAQQQKRLQQQDAEDQNIKGILSQSGGSLETAIPALIQSGPKGAAIANQFMTQQRSGQLADAQIANYGRLADKDALEAGARARQQTAQDQLAGLLSGKGSAGPVTGMPTKMFSSDAEAIKAGQEADAQGIPFRGTVLNPDTVRSLAVQADPQRAIPELLRQQRPSPIETGLGARPVAGGYIQKGADGKPEFIKTREDVAVTGAAGAGAMSPETLKFTAQQIIAGDRQAGQGYARSAPMKAALQNAVAQEAKEQGITGKDLAAIMSEYQGFTAGQRSVGTRQAQIEMAANVTKQFGPIAVTASDAFDRTGIKTLNDVEKAVLSRTSSPELRKFNFANNALINAYARAINPTGVATVSDKDHAREILDTGFSKGDYKAAVEQLLVEMDAELKAPGTVKREMRKLFTTPISTSEVTGFSDQEKEKRYQEWKARQEKK